jgi:hypothetical protein
MSDPESAYTVTKDTGSQSNIYAEGGVYKLQNKWAVEVKYRMVFIATIGF